MQNEKENGAMAPESEGVDSNAAEKPEKTLEQEAYEETMEFLNTLPASEFTIIRAAEPGDGAKAEVEVEEKPKGKKPFLTGKALYGVIGAAIALVCVIILCVVCCGGKATGLKITKEMQAAADARTELVVGIMDEPYPPFVYPRYGTGYAGTDVDMMKSICERYGWRLKLTAIPWEERRTILASGEVDCLVSGFNSYGREEYYAWTDAYLDESDVIVTPKKASGINTIKDLENKTVAVLSGSRAYSELEHIGLGLSRMSCGSIEQLQEALNNKTADAAALSLSDALTLKNVRVLDDRLEVRTYAMACRLGDEVLRDLIQYAFEQDAQAAA